MRIVFVSLLAASLTVFAQPNPGQTGFNTRCARCHGGDATGGEGGPNIVARIAARTDAELAAFLRIGRPASGMPAFDLPAAEMTPLVAHLRSLATPTPLGPLPLSTRRTLTLNTGATLTGEVVNEGMPDLQLRTDDGRVHLLRKLAGDRFREVTSDADWPTYHGVPGGNRYSELTQINKQNLAQLAPRWMFPIPNARLVETTPIVVEGIMYLSSANECWALDAGTGREIWHWQQPRTQGITGNAALGFNRGVAWAGDRIFMMTDHAHIVALNRFTGEKLWDTEMADWHQNYNATSAPLVVNSPSGGLVVTGTAGGDEGARGFIAAYRQDTGEEAWRFWTVPQPGQPGAEEAANTWSGDETLHRSGAAWMTGTYDPESGVVYWPVGNPGPDYFGDEREGDNLYTDSVVALNAATGQLQWHFQFTPHDVHDWDAQEPPVLVDTTWQGRPRKLLLQANRNGFFYVLDRTTGEFLLGKQFLDRLNWATGLDAKGRPILADLPKNEKGEVYVCPGFQGGANWYSTSFNPATGLYYFQALERCNIFTPQDMEWQAGRNYMGGTARPAPGESFIKSVRAINIQTGEVAWDLDQAPTPATASAGLLSTASGLVFFGENAGAFMAADAATGEVLWQFPTNNVWKASPMTYSFDGKQYIAIAAAQNILVFGLP